MAIDLLSQVERKNIIQNIKSEENISRKREHQKRFDVFRERQDRYILERLEREFSAQTLQTMRKVLSINLVPRIIKEMSSIYTNEPIRSFARPGGEIKDTEVDQALALYEECNINWQMQKANEFKNLHKQCALMAVPNMKGSFNVRAIQPMHYDVIPQADDMEKAFAYILNVFDFDLHKTAKNNESEITQRSGYFQQDQVNQPIADDDDRRAVLDRYVVWTDELHFTMNGRGEIVGDLLPNPIGRLPFVDIAEDKDFQFFVRRGANEVDFALDLALLLSDLSNIIRLQGYSQAVMASEKQPQDLNVGVQKVLWLPIDPNRPGPDPKFEFVSPSPDIAGSLQYVENVINIFLSSRGLDPGTVSGKGEARSFSSGIERLLAMLDKFEATKTDFSLFKNAEKELFDILKLWSNEFQSVAGPGELKDELKVGMIGEDVFLDIKFSEPSTVQTKSEKEESVIKLMEQGLMSRLEAIMELRDVEEEIAKKILKDIDQQDGIADRGDDSDGEIE